MSDNIELHDFSLSSNNLPSTRGENLRHRFMKWKNWRRTHPYEEIVDLEANREINSDWTIEDNTETPEFIDYEDIDIGHDELVNSNHDISIDIPGQERTPLLSSGTSGLGSSGGVPSVPAFHTALAGLGALGIGGGLAGLFSQLNKQLHSDRGLTLPNSDYIGPGNKVHIAPARSESDQIAKEHDIEYEKIIDEHPSNYEELVKTADKEAIDRFEAEYQKSGSINAKIGNIGLRTKSFAEFLFGPLYPKITDIDQLANSNQEENLTSDNVPEPVEQSTSDEDDNTAFDNIPDTDQNITLDDIQPDNMSQATAGSSSAMDTPPQTPAKRQKTGNNKQRLPGTGGASGSIDTAGEDPHPIARPFSTAHHNIRVYKKVHRFITFGLAYTPITVARTTDKSAWNDIYMITPMAEIPWDRLFMYLNPSEYQLLPISSRVINMHVSIRSENVRIAFPTNASTSNLATLNQNKFLRIGKGLKQYLQGVNVKPTEFKNDQPMITTTITEQTGDSDYTDYVTQFYGSPNNETVGGFNAEIPKHQFGVPFPLKYYYAQVTQDTDPQKTGWPTFQQYITEVEADSRAGHIMCEMDYEPELGLVKVPARSIYTGVPSSAVGMVNISLKDGVGNTTGRTVQINTVQGVANTKAEVNSSLSFPDIPNSINQIIEKSQDIFKSFNHDVIGRTIPSLHVGLQPIIALSSNVISNDAVNMFTDSQAYFEVECTCAIDTAYPTYRPHATFINTTPGESFWQNSRSGHTPKINSSMYHGLYQY